MKLNIYLLFAFIIFLSACSNSTFNHQPIHSDNFVTTINSYLKESDGGSVFEVNSHFKEISELKNNSTYFYLKGKGTGSLEPMSCEQEQNGYYCKLLLSYLNSETPFSPKEIKETDSFFNMYFLNRTLAQAGDNEGLQELKETFRSLETPPGTDKVEYYFYVVMDFLLNNTVTDIRKDISHFIENYSDEDLLDHNNPIILYAALIINELFSYEVNTNSIKEIYEKKENQTTILFRDEITYWIHLEIVKELENKNENLDILSKVLMEAKPFNSYSYSLESIRNLYLMTNVFASKDISNADEYLKIINHRLRGYSRELEENLGEEIFYQISYLINYAEEITGEATKNKNINSDCDGIELFSEMYFCYKQTDQTAPANSVSIDMSEDLLTKVLKYDIITVSSQDMIELEKLSEDVLKYDEEDFYVILNIYTSLVQRYDLKVDKDLIIKKVEQYECNLGYCEPGGNYVFEVSVYLNNVLNILEGDEFAQKFR